MRENCLYGRNGGLAMATWPFHPKIIEKLKNDYKYNDLDNFIENYLKSESAIYTKKSFLAFLREKIFKI